MIDDNRAKARILDYWRAVELFSPQSVPRINSKDANELVINLTANSIPPWHPSHPLQKRLIHEEFTWRHQVYCGIFDMGEVIRLLEDNIGRNTDSSGEYFKQESAVCAFIISNDGRPLAESLIISTCPWAVARTLTPGPEDPGWLSGFEKLAAEIAKSFPITQPSIHPDPELEIEGYLSSEDASEHELWVMSAGDVHREASRIVVALGAHAFVKEMVIRVKSYRVSRRREQLLDDVDYLNSFFVNDLERVGAAVTEGDIGKGLSDLLGDRSAALISRRVDVRENPAVTFQMLSPARYPQGRWPSRGKSPLFLSQQLTVNHIAEKLGPGVGLSSVNGPPGTGKTTLIRELIAFVVVERAKRLAALKHYDHAFTGKGATWTENGYTRSVSFWHESLTDFEIVIASNNNGAVENIALEIPGINAVDPSYAAEDIYFASFAERLLDAPAWALIAARLGNKTNRNAFVNQFWYGGGSGKSNKREQDLDSFLDYLNNRSEGALDWEVAVDRFKQVIEREAQQRNKRLKIHQLIIDIIILRKQVRDLTRKIDEAVSAQEVIKDEMRVAEENLGQLTDQLKAVIDERLLHQKFRPGLWQIIFSFGKALREWQVIDHDLQQRIDEIRPRQHGLLEVKKEIGERLSKIDPEIERRQKERTIAEASLLSKAEQVGEAEKWLGPHLIRPEVLNDAELRERAQPWSDPEWDETRAQVFLEALNLHKTFIQCNARRMRNNIFAAIDFISGRGPRDLSPEDVRHAWASLFFVIPVISTTFASLDRLFNRLGREQLGWLIIDEAGQATPQSAAGSIWRAKRTVALGDPFQLEPVITLPSSVQDALRRHYRVDKRWGPEGTSLQQLVDEVNPIGSYIDLREGIMWVGSPLRVHKRCDRPMFDISNKVAYSGQMVFDTPKRDSVDLRPSAWIDVIGPANGDHWISEEGRVVHQLIGELQANNKDLDRIIVLTPFRAVARQLYSQTRSYEKVEAGTIHIVQGKEADVVIFVLGGNPERPGAFRWASSRPNLVNVAVSRAKRRLFVIGNKQLWAKYPYFKDMAEILRVNENDNLP